MLSPEMLGETVIVGFFFLLALAPIFLRWRPAWLNHLFDKLNSVSTTGATAAVLLVLVYSLGIAGTLLSEDVTEEMISGGVGQLFGADFERANKNLADWVFLKDEALRTLNDADKAKLRKAYICKQNPKCLSDENCELTPSCAQNQGFFEIAEFTLRERSDGTRARLDREMTYVRIVQGAILSLILLLFSIGVYLFDREKIMNLKKMELRTWLKVFSIYAGIVVLLVMSLSEYVDTEMKYQELVHDLYAGLSASKEK